MPTPASDLTQTKARAQVAALSGPDFGGTRHDAPRRAAPAGQAPAKALHWQGRTLFGQMPGEQRAGTFQRIDG